MPSPKRRAAAAAPLEDRSGKGPQVARLVDVTSEGAPVIELEDRPGRVVARSFLPLGPEELRRAAVGEPEVLVFFEGEDPSRPLVTALRTRPSATPLTDALLEPSATEPRSPVEVSSDGKRVVIEAADELVLRCGAATITLRSDGELVVRGVKIESRASGRHIIRGGKIELN